MAQTKGVREPMGETGAFAVAEREGFDSANGMVRGKRFGGNLTKQPPLGGGEFAAGCVAREVERNLGESAVKISGYVPCFNDGETVLETVKSLQAQRPEL